MQEQVNFRTSKTWDNKTQFTLDDITITTGPFSYNDGKHQIADPGTANAYLVCGGQRYAVENTERIATVEDWYLGQLLPKFQLLSALLLLIPF